MKIFSKAPTACLTVGLTLALVVLLSACQGGDEQATETWTTSSDEARSHFLLGFEAWSKEYYSDAASSFEQALLFDPDFVAARFFLASCKPPGDPVRNRNLQALKEADLTDLTPHERFLVRYDLAQAGQIDEDPEKILDHFLAEYPRDPFGLSTRCDVFWQDQEWDAAESCYNRLLEQHPNLVMAQNRLGFIAMAQGRFSEAEEHFITYRYLAPDQALPYHSMGELLIVLGRYEEADSQLLEALAIKEDFCEAHRLRIKWRTDANQVDEARELLEEMRSIPACAMYSQFGYFCSRAARLHYQEGDLEATWQALAGPCLESRHGFDLLAHRVALATGRTIEAHNMESSLHDYFEILANAELPVYTAFYAALQAHMEGVHLAFDGDPRGAAERFAAADERLGYWGGDRASFKLFNRLNWMYALEDSGEAARAEALRRTIEAINPRFLSDFQASPLDALVRGGGVKNITP